MQILPPLFSRLVATAASLASGTFSVQASNMPAAARPKPAACCREQSASLYSSFKTKMPSGSNKTAAAFLLIPLASAEPSKAATGGQLASPSFFFVACQGRWLQLLLGSVATPEGMGSVLEPLRAAD